MIAPTNQPKFIPCDECEGTGKTYYSCCGDDMRGADIDICPTCKEHQGDEGEPCDTCNGTGHIEVKKPDEN